MKKYCIETNYNAGDIWQSDDGREFLVIRDHGAFCTSLLLNEESKRDGEICVMGRAMRWTHPGMVQYTFHTMLTTFVKEMPGHEFQTVLQAVGDAMGFGMTAPDVSDAAKKIADLEKKNSLLAERAAKAETELENRKMASVGDGIPWKQMYESLIDKLMERK